MVKSTTVILLDSEESELDDGGTHLPSSQSQNNLHPIPSQICINPDTWKVVAEQQGLQLSDFEDADLEEYLRSKKRRMATTHQFVNEQPPTYRPGSLLFGCIATGLTRSTSTLIPRPAPSKHKIQRAKSAEDIAIRNARDQLKAEQKALKEAERQQKKLDKEASKLLKTQEREYHRKHTAVNKLLSKQAYAKELHAYFHNSLITTFSELNQLQSALLEIGIGSTLIDSSRFPGNCLAVQHLPPSECITFTRQSERTYNEVRQCWEPTNCVNVSRVPVVIFLIDGSKLAERILSDSDTDTIPVLLNKHASSNKCYLLVENINLWVRRRKAALIRSNKNPSNSVPNGSVVTDWEVVLNKLIQWRLVHHYTVIISKSRADTLSSLTSLVSEIAALPYRNHVSINDSICSDVHVPSGKNLLNTWQLMLQAIKGVSEPIAQAIVLKFPTMNTLLEAYSKNPGQAPYLLSDLTGPGRTQCIGKTISARIYSMLMSTDGTYSIY